MKLILLQEIERLGERGKVVNVADGYARNFLLPRRLALPASKANLAQLDKIKSQLASRDEKVRSRLTELAEKLGAVAVKATLRMGEAGAFGAVTNADIAALLSEQGYDIDKHAIILDEPVKTPGVHDVKIKLGHEVTATVKLWVAEQPA